MTDKAMEFKHTPAPWKVIDNGTFFDIKADCDYSSLADVCGSLCIHDNNKHTEDGVAYANACLIAAAPELLEALIEIRKLVAHHDKADLAISKALGQQ